MQIGVKVLLLAFATIPLASAGVADTVNSLQSLAALPGSDGKQGTEGNPTHDHGTHGTGEPKGHSEDPKEKTNDPKEKTNDPKEKTNEPKGHPKGSKEVPADVTQAPPVGPPHKADKPFSTKCLHSKDPHCDPKYTEAQLMKRSSCFRYFYHKDQCVTASLESPACMPDAPKVATHVGTFHHPKHHAKQHALSTPPAKLVRRYTTNEDSDWVKGGSGICGFYNTTTEAGVCLWSGAGELGNIKNHTGWLNGKFDKNCGKKIYIVRADPTNPSKKITTYARVLDGCGLHAKVDPAGCFEMFLTNKTFNDLKPTPAEIAQGHLNQLHWGFNNEQGTFPDDAAE